MNLRIWQRLAPLLLLALAACGAQTADMQSYPPGVARTNALYRALTVGEVTGGANTVTFFPAGSFREAILRTLDSAAMLAPAESAARYRLDATLDFSHSGNTLTEYRVDAVIIYRLFDRATGAKLLETEQRSSEAARADSGETAKLIFFGTTGSPATRAFSPQERWNYAYGAAARENLKSAIDALADWGREHKSGQ